MSASATPNTASAVADEGDDRLAAKAHLAVGEHRLVAQIGEHRESIVRHVGSGEDVDDPGPARPKRSEIADLEGRMRMRRADRRAMSAPATPHWPAGRRRRSARCRAPWPARRAGRRVRRPHGRRLDAAPGRPRRADSEHRLDDLAVAGATAQHAGRAHRAPQPRSAADSHAAAPRRSSACRACRHRTAPRRGRRTPAAAPRACRRHGPALRRW